LRTKNKEPRAKNQDNKELRIKTGRLTTPRPPTPKWGLKDQVFETLIMKPETLNPNIQIKNT